MKNIRPKLKAHSIKKGDPEAMKLWVRAGGRCEFLGCNKYLLEDEFTGIEVSLADIAHIVARSPKGPRGENQLKIGLRNNAENLMLLCSEHHNKIIDKGKLVPEFSKEKLLKYKRMHEERIYNLTNYKEGHETTIIRLTGNIRGRSVDIPTEQIRKSVLVNAARYPQYIMGKNIEIDLRNISEKSSSYWKTSKAIIDDFMTRLYAPTHDKPSRDHFSVFALARIPLLIHLGSWLSDKIPTDIYQKHRRGDEGWTWDVAGQKKDFQVNNIQRGKDYSKVALILSLSSKIKRSDLPGSISKYSFIYEISPKIIAPGRDILSTTESLEAFRKTYESVLRIIEKTHKKVKSISLFPAIPVSAAIICGRGLLEDISPALMIYDIGKKKEYKFIMEVKK